jgi:hypothetical protein
VMTSICGLGQVVHKPIQSAMQHFRGEIEAKLDRTVTTSVDNVTRASLAELENE